MKYQTPRRDLRAKRNTDDEIPVCDPFNESGSSFSGTELELELQISTLRDSLSQTQTENKRTRNEIEQKTAYLRKMQEFVSAKREVERLKRRLQSSQSQIVRLSPNSRHTQTMTSSPPVERHLGDSDESAFEYQRRIDDFRRKLRLIDKKLINARQILAQPIDDLRTDILLTKEAEAMLKQAEERFVRSTPQQSRIDIQSSLAKVEQLEFQNQERSKDLESLQSKISADKSALRQSFHTKSTRSPKSWTTAEISDAYDKTTMIDSTYARLKERSDALEQANAHLEVHQRELQLFRSTFEQRWSDKIVEIETLTLQLRDLEIVRLDVDRQQTDNLNLRSDLELLSENRAKLQRRWANLERDLKIQEGKKQKIAEQLSIVQQRTAEIERMTEALKRKKIRVSTLTEEVSSSKGQEKRLSRRVQKLEAETRQVEEANSAVLDRIRNEVTELSVSLLSTDRSPTYISSFEQELEASMYTLS
jgi:chromosome segregation ATPase